jgi:peptide subunit release factor 1 (eRF1)
VIAILLVRLGGYAAGVFDRDELIASKVGSRQVHGRSAAGGWSQHRFARRREGQVKVALDKAADTAAEVILPLLGRLDAVVTGGDRTALHTVLADPRLARLRPLVTARILDVPDPRARVLRNSLQASRAIRVTLSEPD